MDAEQHFQAAAQLYQSGDYPGAEARLEALARDLPGNPNVLHLLSLARLQQDKSEAATESLKELTEIAPNSADAHDLLGCALRQSGRVNAAIRHFQRALEIAPDLAHVHYNLGNAFRDDRQLPQSIIHYKRAAELDPQNLNAVFNLGQAYFNQQDFSRALSAFRAVVDLAPDDVEALDLLGRSAIQAKQFELARKSLGEALRLDPENQEFAYNYAQTVAKLGDFETAAEILDRLLSKLPNDTELLRAQAAVHSAKGDTEKALSFYQRAIDAEPHSPDHRAEFGRLLDRLNRVDDAWSAIEPGLDQHPNSPALNLIAARLERRGNEPDKALARLSALGFDSMEASGAKGEIHFELGGLYDQLGRPGDAVDQFGKGNAILARDTQAVEILQTQSKEYLARLIEAFEGKSAAPSAPPAGLSEMDSPVFLIGFPQSGAALLGQALNAHPGLQVLEEQATLSEVRNRLVTQAGDFPANLWSLPDEALAEMRKVYFAAVDRVIERDPSALLVDNLPLSLLDVGLIYRLFPDARLVFVQRHPCDICLDCFMQPFELNPGTVHFATLDKTVQFFEDVMAPWQIQQGALDLSVHEIRYEDLMGNGDAVLRDLVAFLGIPWDDHVLASPTQNQIRGSAGTDRWRKYELHLSPYTARLKPFISAFGYDG